MNAHKTILAFPLAALIILASPAAWAQSQKATLPFYAATNIQPNVMLLLDSSANMVAVVQACKEDIPAGQNGLTFCKKSSILKRVLTGGNLLTNPSGDPEYLMIGDYIYDPEKDGRYNLRQAMNPNIFVRILTLSCDPPLTAGSLNSSTCEAQPNGDYFTMLLANDIISENTDESVMISATNLGDYMLAHGYTVGHPLYVTQVGQEDFAFDNYDQGIPVDVPRKIYTLTDFPVSTYSKSFTDFFMGNYQYTVPPYYYYWGTPGGTDNEAGLGIRKEVLVIPVSYSKTCYGGISGEQDCWQTADNYHPNNFVFADDKDMHQVARNRVYGNYLMSFYNYLALATPTRLIENTSGFRPLAGQYVYYYVGDDPSYFRIDRRQVFEPLRTCGNRPPYKCSEVQCFPIPECDKNLIRYPNLSITDSPQAQTLVQSLIMKSIPQVFTDTRESISHPEWPKASGCSGLLWPLVYQADFLNLEFTISIECPFALYYGAIARPRLDQHLRNSLGLTGPDTISISSPDYGGFFQGLNYQYVASSEDGVVDIFRNRSRFGMAVFDSGNQPSQNSDPDFDLIAASTGSSTPLDEQWTDLIRGNNFLFNETEVGANLIANLASGDEDPYHDENMETDLLQVSDGGNTPIPSAIYNMATYFDWKDTSVPLTVDPSNLVDWFEEPGLTAVFDDPAMIGKCRQNFLIFISNGGASAGWGTGAGADTIAYDLHALDRLMEGTCGNNCGANGGEKTAYSGDLWQGVKPFIVYFSEDGVPRKNREEMLYLGCYSGVDWFAEPTFEINGENVTDKDFKNGYSYDIEGDGTKETCSSFLYWATDEDSLRLTLVRILSTILQGSYTRSAPVFDAKEEAAVAGFFEIKSGQVLWEGHLFNFDFSEVTNLNSTSVVMVDASSVMDSKMESSGYWADRDIFTVRCEDGSTALVCDDWTKTDFIDNNAGGSANLQLLLQGGDTTKPPKTQADAEALINFIRGMPDSEFKDGSVREYYLGAIYHSQPKVVGAPPLISDNPLLEDYDKFSEKHQSRPALIYVGANDGMFHSFFMDDYNEAQPPDQMEEYFAYIPKAVLATLDLLRSFQWFYVDGSPFAAEIYLPILEESSITIEGNEVKGTAWSNAVADLVRGANCEGLEDCGCQEDEKTKDYSNALMCWRTVLMCGLREGGRSYFALDVTDGNTFGDDLPQITPDGDNNVAPKILPMWEFTDTYMGQSWSTPFIAELLYSNTSQTLEGAKVTQLAALFGGGMTTKDSDEVKEINQGNYFYLVNMDTGKLFTNKNNKIVSRYLIPDHVDPGWKTKVEDGLTVEEGLIGGVLYGNTNKVPSDPTVVDVDRDGIADLVYFGDLQGRLWKLNLHAAPDAADGGWSQRKLCLFYDTGDRTGELEPDGCTPTSGADPDCLAMQRQIFYAPTVIEEPSTNGLLVIFGTGHIETSKAARNETDVDLIFAVLDVDKLEGDTICSYGTLWDKNIGNCALCGNTEIEYPYALQPGEKIIAKPFVMEDMLFFQTYSPITDNVCDPGEVRFWQTNAYSFYGLVNLANPGQKWCPKEVFSTSGLVLTNKYDLVSFTPPGGFEQHRLFESPVSIISWGEGISFELK